MADSNAELVALIRRAFAEILATPDLESRLAAVRRYWAADFVDHSLGEDQASGIAGLLDVIEWIYVNRPETTVTIDAAMAEGDLVVTRETWTSRGGVRTVFHWFRIRGGQVVEEWSGDYRDPNTGPAASAGDGS